VISHIDSILSGSDESAKQTLKEKFQLGDLRDDDFAAYVESQKCVYNPSNVF
jgi:hypothetical protein